MHSVSFVGCFPNNHPNGAGIGGLRGGERRVVNLRAGGWQIFEEKGGKSSSNPHYLLVREFLFVEKK